jgi:hypothetical protein
MGAGSTPINEIKKNNEGACGMHATSLISQEEDLQAERMNENKAACNMHTAPSMKKGEKTRWRVGSTCAGGR